MATTLTTIPVPKWTPRALLGRRLRRLLHIRPAQGPVTVLFEVDTTHVIAGFQRADRASRDLHAAIVARRERAEREAAFRRHLDMVGGESRWYIRGGNRGLFVPTEHLELDRDTYVQGMFMLGLPTQWVVAFLRGWVDSYGLHDRDHYVLHTMFPAGDRVQVSA